MELTDKLCQKLASLNRQFGIPCSLQEAGVPEEEFREKLPLIAENAVADACTLSRIPEIDTTAMMKLLTAFIQGNQ